MYIITHVIFKLYNNIKIYINDYAFIGCNNLEYIHGSREIMT